MLACKLCGKETKHHNLGDDLPAHIRFKCSVCGEYNQEEQVMDQDRELLDAFRRVGARALDEARKLRLEEHGAVTLKPKTRHGKNRISQHGERWLVTSVGDFAGSGRLSVALRSDGCECMTCEKFGQDARVIHAVNDANFEIVDEWFPVDPGGR